MAAMVDGIEVLSPAPIQVRQEYEAEAVLDGVQVRNMGDAPAILFNYVHAMSRPSISPSPAVLGNALVVEADAPLILRFGMLEATARVSAASCVYDPQSAFAPEPFHANGSRAERLAVVANRAEVCKLGDSGDVNVAAAALRSAGAEVVIVKSGAEGALVFDGDSFGHVPARLTNHVWTVGSGDVFAAIFTAAWAVHGQPAREAANVASYAVAQYVETSALPIAPSLLTEQPERPPVSTKPGRVYLAGPFFNMPQRWLVDEARRCLRDLGLEVFSPVHDVGRGPAEVVAPADIQALEGCDRVFLLLDGLDSGTVFEAGFARARNIPVYAFAQVTAEDDMKMLVGTGCIVGADFVTMLHRCAWLTP